MENLQLNLLRQIQKGVLDFKPECGPFKRSTHHQVGDASGLAWELTKFSSFYLSLGISCTASDQDCNNLDKLLNMTDLGLYSQNEGLACYSVVVSCLDYNVLRTGLSFRNFDWCKMHCVGFDRH